MKRIHKFAIETPNGIVLCKTLMGAWKFAQELKPMFPEVKIFEFKNRYSMKIELEDSRVTWGWLKNPEPRSE